MAGGIFPAVSLMSQSRTHVLCYNSGGRDTPSSPTTRARAGPRPHRAAVIAVMPILPVSAASLFASLPAAAAAAVVPVPPAVLPAIPMAFSFVLYAAATLAVPPSVSYPVPVVPLTSARSTAAAAAIPVLARLPAVRVFVVPSASLGPGTGSVGALAASTFPTRTTAAPASI